jgi:hypothetical protein
LTELWFGLHAKRWPGRNGSQPDARLMEEIKQKCPLPMRIDFRTVE